jgi:hypothetical protein
MATSQKTRTLYQVLDREPKPVLQTVELLRSDRDWLYVRCLESGLEFRVKRCYEADEEGEIEIPTWSYAPDSAWFAYYLNQLYSLKDVLVGICRPGPSGFNFATVQRLFRRAEDALYEVKRLEGEGD